MVILLSGKVSVFEATLICFLVLFSLGAVILDPVSSLFVAIPVALLYFIVCFLYAKIRRRG